MMLLENRRFRLFTVLYMILAATVSVAVWFLCAEHLKITDNAYQQFAARMMAAYDGERIEDDAIPLEKLQKADRALQKAGYKDLTVYKMDREVWDTYKKTVWIFEGSIWMVLIILYVIICFFTWREFSRIKELYEDMEMVLETGQVPRYESYEEGVIGKLDNSYHKLVHALKISKENELKEKEFLRDSLSDISHQMKTPIASMVVFNDLLLENKVDEEAKETILKENKKQIERLEWLVLSMLKMARLEAQSVEFNVTKQPLRPTIEMAISGVAAKLDRDRQKIVNCCNENIYLMHDVNWMVEALGNILNNAVDHIGDDGEVIINVESTSFFVRISIRDNGCGIPEEEIPHVFERFHRGKNNPNPNSVGIGLALTKAIIKGQNGEITVKSVVGEFTEFVIVMPTGI